MSDEQDKLAEEWAAALEAQEDEALAADTAAQPPSADAAADSQEF